jgi:hypothetical protein
MISGGSGMERPKVLAFGCERTAMSSDQLMMRGAFVGCNGVLGRLGDDIDRHLRAIWQLADLAMHVSRERSVLRDSKSAPILNGIDTTKNGQCGETEALL